jgi:outer membrane protein OmpA-like peptidoglycan-associated protein
VQRVLDSSRQDEEGEIVSSDIEQVIKGNLGAGQPLDDSVRARMEPAFIADFSGVRVHTNPQADTLNRALNARAFTTGRDIFFRNGDYKPGSSSGRELLAHELTHVVQQSGSQSEVGQALRVAPSLVPDAETKGGSGASAFSDNSDDVSSPPEKVDSSADGGCPAAKDQPYLDDNRYLWVKFSVGSSSPAESSKAFIDEAVGKWILSPSSQPVRIDGFASSDGDAEKNWLLSCERAKSVKAELENPSDKGSGIPTSSIIYFAHGETNRFSSSDQSQNRIAIITGINVPERKGAESIGFEKVVEPGTDEYARPFLGSTIMRYVGNNYVFLTHEKRYTISPTLGKAFNYGRALFGALNFGIVIGELDDTGAVLYFTVPLKESVTLEDLNPTPLTGGAPGDQAYDGEVYPSVGSKGEFSVIGVFIDNANFVAAPTRQQMQFIRSKLQAELKSGLGKIQDETVEAILQEEAFKPIDQLIRDRKTGEAADKLAELAEPAFALLDFETKAKYISILLDVWTHQRHEKAIVEIVKSTQTFLELQAILEILKKEGALSKLLTDVDYELWKLFESIGRKYGVVKPVTSDGVWKLLEGFGLSPFASTNAEDLENEISSMWDTFLDFLVATWESLLLIVTQPDKILRGVGEFGKMLVMHHLATNKSVDLMAKILGLAGINELKEWQSYAEKYMEGLLTAFGARIRHIMAGVEIVGVERELGIRLRWALVWEIVSMFIGVGEVKALLTAFKATFSLRVLSRVLRIFGIADAAELAKYAAKFEEVAAAIGKVSDLLKAEDEILQLLNYLSERDALRLKALFDKLGNAKIRNLSDLGDFGLELRKKVESLSTLSQKAGGLTSEVIEAYQRLAGSLKDPEELLQIMRLVGKDQGVLFAKIVNIAPIEEPGFYKMLAQSESGMKAMIDLGYPALKNIYRRTGGDIAKLDEYLQAIDSLRSSLPRGLQSTSLQKLFDEIGPVDLDTYKHLARAPELVKALIENPRAAKFLKKCASPCYPPEMKVTHIQNLERALRKAERQGIPVDEGKLVDYLYDHRDDLGKVTKELNKDPSLLKNLQVKRITADEIVENLGKAVEPHRAAIAELLEASFPSRELERVLQQAIGRGDEHLANILKFLATFKDPKPTKLGALLDDLTKTGRTYNEAFDFLRKMNANNLSDKFDELYIKNQEGFIIVGQRSPQTPDTGAIRHDFTVRDGKIEFVDRDVSNNHAAYDFVMTADGQIRIGNGHFYLADNADYVRAAGNIYLERGKITSFGNNSGHYQPMNQELLDAIKTYLMSKEYVAPKIGWEPYPGR